MFSGHNFLWSKIYNAGKFWIDNTNLQTAAFYRRTEQVHKHHGRRGSTWMPSMIILMWQNIPEQVKKSTADLHVGRMEGNHLYAGSSCLSAAGIELQLQHHLCALGGFSLQSSCPTAYSHTLENGLFRTKHYSSIKFGMGTSSSLAIISTSVGLILTAANSFSLVK